MTASERIFNLMDVEPEVVDEPDAIEIDGTHLTLNQVVDAIIARVDDVTRAGTT